MFKVVPFVLCLVACGGPIPDYVTERGMEVFNQSTGCPQGVVQKWEDEAVLFWSKIEFVDLEEDDYLDVELICSKEFSFELDKPYKVNGVEVTRVAGLLEDGHQIYLSNKGVGELQKIFNHEFGHWVLRHYSDIPKDPKVHHSIFRGVDLPQMEIW